MSVINKKPFINKVLDTLTVSDLATLKNLIDGSGDDAVSRSLLPQSTKLLTEDDKGIKRVQLEVTLPMYAAQSTYTGYLIYNDEYCVLIAYNNDNKYQLLTMINMTTDENGKWSFEPVNEELTILGLRSELDDTASGEEAEAVAAVADALDDGDLKIVSDNVDSETATSGQVLAADGNGGASWQDASGGIDKAEKQGQVLVADENLEYKNADYVPLANNLYSTAGSENDTMYSAGSTGGSADIDTNSDAILQTIKGYTVIWNQLIDANHSYTCKTGHYYVRLTSANSSASSFALLGPNSTSTISANANTKLWDLTLMFGGNDNIPFSLTTVTEYPANGDLPAQTCAPSSYFQRLFANVDLYNDPYDAGTPKNVNVSQLTETGQNLFDVNGDGFVRVLAGYRYEVYYSGACNTIKFSTEKDGTYSSTSLNLKKIGNGYYIWYWTCPRNGYIKSETGFSLSFVGFVHSGNYCLTTGTSYALNWALTYVTIPEYTSNTYTLSGISNLKGIPDSSNNHCTVYDTKDMTRVGIVDLSTLSWAQEDDDEWTATAPANAKILDDGKSAGLISTGISVNFYNGKLDATSSTSPTGILYYELAEPVPTGEDAFEPITLKVNDMGFEYFNNTYCPVNQTTTYVINLKDKLVNLSIPEIEAIDWNYSNAALKGLKIGDNYYKVLFQNNPGSMSSLSDNAKIKTLIVGFESTAFESNFSTIIGASNSAGYSGSCVIVGYNNQIGNNSYRSFSSVAIGQGITVYSPYSVAIGAYACNYIATSVSFDGTNSNYQRTLQLYDPSHIFFRNENVSSSKTTFASYTSGHYLSEYIQSNELVSDGTKYYLTYTDSNNYTTFTKNVVSGTSTDINKMINGVHITIIITDSASAPTYHSVVGLDLMLYDSTNSLPYKSYGRVDCDGTVEDISAYIDSNGRVIIEAPTGTVIESVKYNIK